MMYSISATGGKAASLYIERVIEHHSRTGRYPLLESFSAYENLGPEEYARSWDNERPHPIRHFLFSYGLLRSPATALVVLEEIDRNRYGKIYRMVKMNLKLCLIMEIDLIIIAALSPLVFLIDWPK